MKKKMLGTVKNEFSDDTDEEETEDEDDEIYEKEEFKENEESINVNRSVLKHSLTRKVTIDLGTHKETRQYVVATPDSQIDATNSNGQWGPIYHNHPELPFRAGLADALYGARFCHDTSHYLRKKRQWTSFFLEAASFASGGNTGNSVPDLLQTLHLYAAELYEALGYKQAYMSMDETALLGLGVVVEEFMKSLVGQEGHRMYAEREKSEMEEYFENLAVLRREKEKQEVIEKNGEMENSEDEESVEENSLDESSKEEKTEEEDSNQKGRRF